jgi:hypothetical protein
MLPLTKEAFSGELSAGAWQPVGVAMKQSKWSQLLNNFQLSIPLFNLSHN